MKVERIIQIWGQLREGLIKTIEKFNDEDLKYVAFEDGYSVGEIILHIAQEEYGEIQYGLTRTLNEFPHAFPIDEYPTIDSMKTLLARVHEETIEYLLEIEDQQLENEFEAQWGETRPFIDFVHHVMEHEIHHRGELSFVLGLLGRQGYDA